MIDPPITPLNTPVTSMAAANVRFGRTRTSYLDHRPSADRYGHSPTHDAVAHVLTSLGLQFAPADSARVETFGNHYRAMGLPDRNQHRACRRAEFPLFTSPISIGQSRHRHTTLVGRQPRPSRNDVVLRVRPRQPAPVKAQSRRVAVPRNDAAHSSESRTAEANFANAYTIDRSKLGVVSRRTGLARRDTGQMAYRLLGSPATPTRTAGETG